MSERTFAKGDTVYGIDGQQAEYLMVYEDAHLVLPMLRDDDGFSEEPWPGEPTVWQEVFAKPPVPVVHEEVAEARRDLDEVQKQLRDAEQQLRKMESERLQLQREQAAVRTRLAEERGLRHLDDFLAGKITHFLVISDYHAPRVRTFDEVMVREERRSGKELRLLGLFGDAQRGLRWKVTPYGDGSGSTTDEVIPCTSLEEAQALQVERIKASWEHIRRDGRFYAVTETVDLARQLGLEVPQDLADKATEIRRNGAASTLKSRREEFARAQRQLAEAEAAATAAGLDVSSGSQA